MNNQPRQSATYNAVEVLLSKAMPKELKKEVIRFTGVGILSISTISVILNLIIFR